MMLRTLFATLALGGLGMPPRAAAADRFQMVATDLQAYLQTKADKHRYPAGRIDGTTTVIDTVAGTIRLCKGEMLSDTTQWRGDSLRCNPAKAVAGLGDGNGVTYTTFPLKPDLSAYGSFFRLEQSAARIAFCVLLDNQAHLICTAAVKLD